MLGKEEDPGSVTVHVESSYGQRSDAKCTFLVSHPPAQTFVSLRSQLQRVGTCQCHVQKTTTVHLTGSPFAFAGVTSDCENDFRGTARSCLTPIAWIITYWRKRFFFLKLKSISFWKASLKKYFATKRKLFKGHHSDALFRLPTKLQGEPHHHMFCKFSTETPKPFSFKKNTKNFGTRHNKNCHVPWLPPYVHKHLNCGPDWTAPIFQIASRGFAEIVGMRQIGWLDVFKEKKECMYRGSRCRQWRI